MDISNEQKAGSSEEPGQNERSDRVVQNGLQTCEIQESNTRENCSDVFFQVAVQQIQTIQEKPVKSLGECFCNHQGQKSGSCYMEIDE